MSLNGGTHVSLTDAKSLSNWLKEIYNLSYKDFEKYLCESWQRLEWKC
jgi:hypothetical protein